MTRLLLALILLALPAGAQDQTTNRWHDTELEDLRQPARTIKLGLPFDGLVWFHPFDPIDWVSLFRGGFVVQLVAHPPVELASWIDHDWLDDPARRASYRKSQRRIIRTPEEAGWNDETFARFTRRGASASLPSAENVEAARYGLRNTGFIGRMQEVQQLLKPRVVLVEDLQMAPGLHSGGVTLGERLIAIDVARGPETKPDDDHILHRGWLETYAHELGHVFWYALNDAERSAFEQRFWPNGDAPKGTTVSGYARTNVLEDFAESFQIAVLYPTTYATEPVLGRDVLRPWTDTPMPASAIERVRHIDVLITAKTGRPAPTTKLRDNRISRMLDSFATPEDAEDEPAEFDLREALNRTRDD
ncbi:MAG: hypothetical protein AAFR76_04430 [Planctomycetota bacterium]